MNDHQIGIYFKVKFRALRITLGSIEKSFRVNVPKFTWGATDDVPPENAKQLFNDRGVTLKVWLMGGCSRDTGECLLQHHRIPARRVPVNHVALPAAKKGRGRQPDRTRTGLLPLVAKSFGGYPLTPREPKF